MDEYKQALQRLVDSIDQNHHFDELDAAREVLARPDLEHPTVAQLAEALKLLTDCFGAVCDRIIEQAGTVHMGIDWSAAKRAVDGGKQLFSQVEPAAAEKAREPKPEDMAMLIRQLCSALNRFNPGGPTAIRAMQYLASHGLEGSVLRDLPSPPAATGEKP